jgi:hypothetical protein
MRIQRVGYDRFLELEEKEIEIMYLEEGVSPLEAIKRAKSLSREMYNMVSREKYSWHKCRKHESTGINIDTMTSDED